jgi:hypothetical protein
LPSLDKQQGEVKRLTERYFNQLLASAEELGVLPNVDQAADRKVAEQELARLKEEMRERAQSKAEYALRCGMTATLATADRKLLREANLQTIKAAVDKISPTDPDRIKKVGIARYQARMQCLPTFEVRLCFFGFLPSICLCV